MYIKGSCLVIPIEIVEEILFRLPVKSLVRLRCVSKTWRALISDPIFIERHLVHSRNHHPGIIIESNYYHYQKRLYILCQSWCPDRTIEPDQYFKIIQCSNYERLYTLDHQSSSSRDEAQSDCAACVVGSCDGLLFLASYPLKSMLMWWLYNPSTRKYKRLPIPIGVIPPEASSHDEIYGFGYNATFNDYQVIRILQCYYKKLDTRHFKGEVYSLRNNLWREIQGPQIIQLKMFCSFIGVFVNDAIHWAFKDDNSRDFYGVVAFKFATEEFFVLPLPDFQTDESCNILQVVVIGGCLCLICIYENYFEGWMMRDYGVKESWTKFFEMAGNAPRCSVREGEVRLLDARNIFVHNEYLHYYKSEDTSIVRLPVPLPLYPGSICFAASYVESLIPLS